MSEKNRNFYTKVIHYALFFLWAVFFSLQQILTITGLQMNYLSYLLYDKSHLSAVSRLLNQFILRKLLISVVLYLCVLILIYIFYFSYYQIIYAKLAILCVCCTSYCMTLSETNTIFYVGTDYAQKWNNAGIIATLFLTLMLLQLAFDSVLERLPLLFSVGLTAFYLLLAMFIRRHRFSANVKWMPLFFCSLLLVALVLLVLVTCWEGYKELLCSIPTLLGSMWLLYTNYVYRFHDGGISLLNSREKSYNSTLFVAVLITFWILGSTLIRKRTLLMHSRELNRKIQELENVKSILLGVLYSNVKNCIFSANTALDTLQESSTADDSQRAVQQVQTELSNIDALYNQIHNYTIFSGNAMNPYRVRINICIFFTLLCQQLEYKHLFTEADTVQISAGKYKQYYSDIYPEHFLQTLGDFLSLMRQNNPVGCFHISSALEPAEIVLSLCFSCAKSQNQKPRKQKPSIFHMQNPAVADPTILDYSISLLRHQIKAWGGHLSVKSSEEFLLKITFPVTAYEPEPYQQETFFCEKKEVEHLLVLSSDPQQMEALKKLLPFDRYHITMANDADYYYEHLQELEQFSLLIVGNLYRLTYFRDFYNQVRRRYAMTALPILMLLPDLYSENSFYIRNTINDYIIPPYSQASISKKIHSLLMVKKTADIALETQLKFWQSQINPHFIFNSINSIMHMCIREPMTAYELLGDFSEYLRGHLLSQPLERLSTIRKEVDLIQAYLQIEKARFGDKIDYEIDIDCDENFPILPLLIEPLIENSIKHSPMHESGVRINVHIYQQNEQLLVRVEDDGNGMPPETVQAVLSNTYESNSIGLSNLCSRLQHYYHTMPTIKSVPSEGTVVEFTIQRRSSHATGNDY